MILGDSVILGGCNMMEGFSVILWGFNVILGRFTVILGCSRVQGRPPAPGMSQRNRLQQNEGVSPTLPGRTPPVSQLWGNRLIDKM